MFCGLCIGLMLVLNLWPETPFAKMLHRHLVERPVEFCQRLTRAHLFYAAAVIFVLLTMGEMIALFGGAELAFVYAWDLSLFLDAALATYALGAVTHVRTLSRWTATRVAALVGKTVKRPARQRQFRAVRKPGPLKASNDEEGGRAVTLKLAA